MRATVAISAVVLLLLPQKPEKDGRKGNRLYEEGRYLEAANLFLAGLEADADPDLRAALLNNLGAAHYRMEDYETAQPAFVRSFAASESSFDRSRAAYNAGNTAFRRNDLRAALSFYQQALLADPQNESARFNYEFVRRRLKDEDQQSEQESQDRIEPSEFAKALKAQADELVAERKYRAAYDLMLDGMKIDNTVQAYQDFISRTGKIADIDQPITP